MRFAVWKVIGLVWMHVSVPIWWQFTAIVLVGIALGKPVAADCGEAGHMTSSVHRDPVVVPVDMAPMRLVPPFRSGFWRWRFIHVCSCDNESRARPEKAVREA